MYFSEGWKWVEHKEYHFDETTINIYLELMVFGGPLDKNSLLLFWTKH